MQNLPSLQWWWWTSSFLRCFAVSTVYSHIFKAFRLLWERNSVYRIKIHYLGKWPTWHTTLCYVFISILYMFRATSCSSSGESIVSIQHVVYVTLCRWPFSVQVGKELSVPHTKRSPTQIDIYQMMYWYNWYSWRWAQGCWKHVGNWNKYTEKNCASSWSFTKNHNKIHCQQSIKNSLPSCKISLIGIYPKPVGPSFIPHILRVC
jgi:hypothetical protein